MASDQGPRIWKAPASVHSLLGSVAKSESQLWQVCLTLAEHAASLDEVPVGAVIVDREGVILGMGHDLKMAWNDPTAHAELIAIRQASEALGDWRLDGCRLFVSLEPCAMCAGTILLSRLKEINYANSSPKFGAVESKINLFESAEWNHQVEVKLAPAATTEASARILKNYFAAKRKSN